MVAVAPHLAATRTTSHHLRFKLRPSSGSQSAFGDALILTSECASLLPVDLNHEKERGLDV